jgi:hypothetical protein
MATKTQATIARQLKAALDAMHNLDALCETLDDLSTSGAKALLKMLVNAHRNAYEGMDIECPTGRDWNLRDTDIIRGLIDRICDEHDLEWPEIEGLRS